MSVTTTYRTEDGTLVRQTVGSTLNTGWITYFDDEGWRRWKWGFVAPRPFTENQMLYSVVSFTETRKGEDTVIEVVVCESGLRPPYPQPDTDEDRYAVTMRG